MSDTAELQLADTHCVTRFRRLEHSVDHPKESREHLRRRPARVPVKNQYLSIGAVKKVE